MTEPSERIRAALLRNASARSSRSPAPTERESRLPTIAISAENLEALLGSGTPKDPKLTPAVEVLLPMLGASDEERLRIAGSLEPVANTAAQSPAHVVSRPELTSNGATIAPIDVVQDVTPNVAWSGRPTDEVIPKPVPQFIFEQAARDEVTLEETVHETTKESTKVEIAEVTGEPGTRGEKSEAALSAVPPAPPFEKIEKTTSTTLETTPVGARDSSAVPLAPPVFEQNRAALEATPPGQTMGSKYSKAESVINDAPVAPTNNIGATLFAEAPPPPTEEEIARHESRKQFIRWIAPGVILLLIASGITTYLLVSRQAKTPPPATALVQPAAPSTPPAAQIPLRLDVELQSNGQIVVRWDPLADAVARARDGRLMVTEQGQAARVMPLTREQLGIGRFSYQPSSERIEFRLEVVDQAGAVAEDSVLAMSPQAAATGGNAAPRNTPGATNGNLTPPAAANSPADLPAIAKSLPPQTSLQHAPSALVAAPTSALVSAQAVNAYSPNAPTPNAFSEEIPRARATPRIFAPPVTRPGGDEIRTVILAPPTIAPVATPLPAGVPAQEPFASLAPPPSAPAPPPPPPLQIRVGGNIQAGLLVKRVTPEYPAVAKAARVQGDVRFSAIIGKDGHIRDLQANGGPAILIPPALTAVKQWVYRPTLLNGQPVEVVTQIDVNFTLGQ